jgi:hypothetical protein
LFLSFVLFFFFLFLFPFSVDKQRVFHFKLLVERLLRRHREKTLLWMMTPQADGIQAAPGVNVRAETIRTIPIFRLLRHLESTHITSVLILALDREVDTSDDVVMAGGRGRGMMRTGVVDHQAPEKKQIIRWSNKFDLVRVLLHKMKMLDDTELGRSTASNAALMLVEVLRHSNSHVDLLKNVMLGAPLLFDLALGTSEEEPDAAEKQPQQQMTEFQMAQFNAVWTVILDLCRCLGRIWLPNRHTRIISDTIQVFVTNLPKIFQLLKRQSPERLGMVRVAVAEYASICCAGRLVSLFAEPFLKSGVLQELLSTCVAFPQAGLFHLSVFASCLIPMIQNCIPILAVPDDVFVPAADQVKTVVEQLKLWEFVVENHYSYSEATEANRNKYAFNGYLTQLANALVNSSYPLSEQSTQFVGDNLDWTNTLENTPLTSSAFSTRFDTAGSSSSSSSGSSGSEEEEATEDPVALGEKKDGRNAAVAPVSVAGYNTPPRPRLPADKGDEENSATEEEAEEAEEVVAATGEEEEKKEEEEKFDLISFWSIPIDDSLLL